MNQQQQMYMVAGVVVVIGLVWYYYYYNRNSTYETFINESLFKTIVPEDNLSGYVMPQDSRADMGKSPSYDIRGDLWKMTSST